MLEAPVIGIKESELPEGTRKIDILAGALEELLLIEYPPLKRDPAAKERLSSFIAEKNIAGIWVYYPWRKAAVHMPPEEIYFKLRTARNRNLITEAEQNSYRNLRVGIAGLSVGSAVVSSLVATGGPKHLKIADFDTLEVTNLNRIRATLLDVGENKAEIAARTAWELDPFAEIELYREGLREDTLVQFLAKPKLDVFIDEMDDLRFKVLAREECRKLKIPVLMATDNGDSAILDVERFDLEDAPPFHGRIALDAATLVSLTPQERMKAAVTIIDPAFYTQRQQESINVLGKDIAGIPQLGTSALLGAGAITYALRQIAIHGNMPSGRYVLSFEEACTPGYHSAESKKERELNARRFAEARGVPFTDFYGRFT